jgi:hypothetical protein
MITWRRIREGMVCARPHRNSGILSLEEKMKNLGCRSGCVTKIPWHNIDECRSKQSLVAEIKDKEPNPDSESGFEILVKDRSLT